MDLIEGLKTSIFNCQWPFSNFRSISFFRPFCSRGGGGGIKICVMRQRRLVPTTFFAAGESCKSCEKGASEGCQLASTEWKEIERDLIKSHIRQMNRSHPGACAIKLYGSAMMVLSTLGNLLFLFCALAH